MLSPGAAFLVAYLPAHRIAHMSRAWLESGAASIEEIDERLRKLAGVVLPVLPPVTASPAMAIWLRSLPEFMTPQLTTPLLRAAWAAGETARAVAVDVLMASHVARLRLAAPNDFELRTQAEQLAKLIVDASTHLQRALEATGVPLVGNHSNEVRTVVEYSKDLAPTKRAGSAELDMLARRVIDCIELHGRQFDAETGEPRGQYIPQILESIGRSETHRLEQPKKSRQWTMALDGFSTGARQVIAKAQQLADDHRHVHMTATHLLSALLALPPLEKRLEAVGGDVDAALVAAEAAFAAMPTSNEPSHLSDPLVALLRRLQNTHDEVTLEHLLIECIALPSRETLEDIDENGVDTPEEALRRTVISAGHLDRLVPQ